MAADINEINLSQAIEYISDEVDLIIPQTGYRIRGIEKLYRQEDIDRENNVIKADRASFKPDDLLDVSDEILLIATACRLQCENQVPKIPLPEDLHNFFEEIKKTDASRIVRGEILLSSFQNFRQRMPQDFDPAKGDLVLDIDPPARIPSNLVKNLIKMKIDKAPAPKLEFEGVPAAGFVQAPKPEAHKPQKGEIEGVAELEEEKLQGEKKLVGDMPEIDLKKIQELNNMIKRVSDFIERAIEKLGNPTRLTIKHLQKQCLQAAQVKIKELGEKYQITPEMSNVKAVEKIHKKATAAFNILNELTQDAGGLKFPPKVTGVFSAAANKIRQWFYRTFGEPIRQHEIEAEKSAVLPALQSFRKHFHKGPEGEEAPKPQDHRPREM